MMGPQHHRGRGRHRGGPPEFGMGRIAFGPDRGPRARRGDVRAAILALLAENPMHGYEMIQEIEERTDGLWRPSAGSIYPTLQLLEDEGLIAGEEAEGKRRFTLTDAGTKANAERGDEAPPWEQVTDDAGDSTRDLVREFQKLAGRLQAGRADRIRRPEGQGPDRPGGRPPRDLRNVGRGRVGELRKSPRLSPGALTHSGTERRDEMAPQAVRSLCPRPFKGI